MLKTKSLFLCLVLWGASLIGLSYASHYSIRGSVRSINFDIATMLTPYGFFHNLVLTSDHPLRPYYFNIAEAHQNMTL